MNQMTTTTHLSAAAPAGLPARIAVICSSWHSDIVDKAKQSLLAELHRSPTPPGQVDQFEPADFEGEGGRRDLFVHNHDWFGMIKARPTLSLQRLYYRWIHNYRYGRNW